jgi:YebC/PmpR family DNA-binding regulatory protein
MSGHSHWATIKHKKGALDAKRGKLWSKLARAIIVAAKNGGGDPAMNMTLRYAVDKAKAANMPKDTIEKAIKRGTGELEGVRYESITYEGYAPCGVAVYIEALSDNRNRTSADVRSTFSKLGGSIAEPGAVSWQFERKGVFLLPKSAGGEDDLMAIGLDAGLEDLEDQGDSWQMISAPHDFATLKQALDDAGIAYESADLTMVATTTVPLDNESDARKVLRLLEALEDNDDVQNVFANFDIPDAVLELVEA